MSIQISLLRCTAERQRINKSGYISGSWICEGDIKENTSVMTPTIMLKKNTPPMDSKYNYMRIPAFGRYYYIEDIENVNDTFWIIRAKCDVLYTYRTDILNSRCILDKTEEPGKANLYYDDGSFVMDSRKYNQVLDFPYGLPEQGYNILICAGGV